MKTKTCRNSHKIVQWISKLPYIKKMWRKKVPPKLDTITVTESQCGNYNKKMTWKWHVCEETTVTSPENEAGLLTADQRCS